MYDISVVVKKPTLIDYFLVCFAVMFGEETMLLGDGQVRQAFIFRNRYYDVFQWKEGEKNGAFEVEISATGVTVETWDR